MSYIKWHLSRLMTAIYLWTRCYVLMNSSVFNAQQYLKIDFACKRRLEIKDCFPANGIVKMI